MCVSVLVRETVRFEIGYGLVPCSLTGLLLTNVPTVSGAFGQSGQRLRSFDSRSLTDVQHCNLY
jgi:hypothetical protein